MKTSKNTYLIFLVGFILVFVLTPGYCSYPLSEQHIVSAVEKVEPSVVFIKTIWIDRYGRTQVGMGSGVIITDSGWIITNAHVTRNARKIFVTLNDGRTVQAAEWKAQPEEDIAVVKVSAQNLPVAPMGNSSGLKKGQVAIAIGNPWRFESTVTVGCISATGRQLEAGSLVLKDMIQTDTAINPGNSGGALVNSRGQVIGINTLVYTGSGSKFAQGLSFAIPINQAVKIANSLIQKRESVQQPWLGVSVINVTPQMNLGINYGALITGFPPYSPANKIGVQIGDVIVALDSYKVNNSSDLRNILFRYKPGDAVTITVVRGNKKLRGKVILEGMRQ
ncbi:MAG: S1C family serine protease [Vulcanimicrobiota bacterium]